MPAAIKPTNEESRLDYLNGLHILDTLPEKEYDDIVKLASVICETPISLISLVDDDRQWFKSKVGLETSETHRDLAFCAHSILSPDTPLIVEDATKDKRFLDNDLVTGGPKIRFYAGYPLNTETGHSLGTLCAIDTKPKKLSEQQIDALRILASNVMSLLQLRKANATNIAFLEKLSESNQELERFAFICAHDLQEPLRMIRSFSDKLQTHLKEQLVDDEKGKKYFHFVTDGAKRSQDLIRDILDYSRIGADTGDLESFDCDELIHTIEENMQDTLKEKGAQIVYDSLPEIRGNKTQLLQLFQNLINNGLKYQKSGTHPRIHIDTKEDEKQWIFSIKDNGIGMEKRHLDKIFDVFQRLHRKSEYSGTGIGLSICKKVVDGHDGKIWVESEKDIGSTFYFTISKAA